MSDEDFEAIQRAHYDRRQDPKARMRAKKSLESCLEAIAAFREIAGISPVVSATPDDCAAFQRRVLELPKSWRLKYPHAKKERPERYSPHTVLKWSTALQAAFERASINGGKKCIRGVVNNAKLLTTNPWKAFTWIEGADKPIRQFTAEELRSILEYFGSEWEEITVAPAAAKACLWSWCRVTELVNLKWEDLRIVGTEYHFQIIGKWGVEKWARIPRGLYQDLLGLKTASPYVFAAYNNQLRQRYTKRGLHKCVTRVGETYNPDAFANWLQERIPAWARATGNPHATIHVFRKTALQYARRGEDLNRLVAQDARVSTSVMMRHYVMEQDEELRQSSNRTFARIVASLPPEVATRYGYPPENKTDDLEARLAAATSAQDWNLVTDLARQLAERAS
jgi:integrase